jgi:tryptophan-rich sensory protein
MGYASYLIYEDENSCSERDLALILYVIQLGLNWIWSPIFFKYKKLGLVYEYFRN